MESIADIFLVIFIYFPHGVLPNSSSHEINHPISISFEEEIGCEPY